MNGCVRPGCGGTYLEDGSCDVCGFGLPTAAQPARVDPEPASTASSLPSGCSTAGRRTGTGRRAAAVAEQDLPPVVVRDPRTAVLSDPQMPLAKRKCRVCEQPVGQPRDGRPGLVEGFCPRDRTPFSFAPPLREGDRIGQAGRYEIAGALAYGGFGWVYLARDLHLGDEQVDHWVVLKGLIDPDDPDAIAAAVNERRFLVEVDHPNIVKIHDFVRYDGPRAQRPVDYIVMEYVGGRTLRDLAQRHRDERDRPAPLPLAMVLRCALGALAALEYLHERGLVYCDLKPENIMQVERRIKLIDLGAVWRVGGGGSVFGTEGYQAADIEAHKLPTPGSDLHTLGRTMAVLSFPFHGFTKQHRHTLPDRAREPLFVEHESYYRLLRRATHLDPDRRFATAPEMREQLRGVLTEVEALESGAPVRTTSTLFTPERRVFGTWIGAVRAGDPDWAELPMCLPVPLVDPADPAAAFLATLGVVDPDALLGTLEAAPARSPEVLLRLVEARVAAGDPVGARACVEEFAAAMPGDWRVDWYLGLLALADGAPAEAVPRFDAVWDELPGELAPRLALAAAAERAGETTRARELYARVWAVDDSWVGAAFGLARTSGPAEAVAVLDAVPDSSAHHGAARVAAVRALVSGEGVAGDALAEAERRVGALRVDAEARTLLTIEVLGAALERLEGRGQDAGDEHRVRVELERAYRDLARLTPGRADRSALVDRANQVRPRTLV